MPSISTMKKLVDALKAKRLNRVRVPFSGLRIGEYRSVKEMPRKKYFGKHRGRKKSVLKDLELFRLNFLEQFSLSKL